MVNKNQEGQTNDIDGKAIAEDRPQHLPDIVPILAQRDHQHDHQNDAGYYKQSNRLFFHVFT